MAPFAAQQVAHGLAEASVGRQQGDQAPTWSQVPGDRGNLPLEVVGADADGSAEVEQDKTHPKASATTE